MPSNLAGISPTRRLPLHRRPRRATDKGLEHLNSMTRRQLRILDHTAVTDAGVIHLKGLAGLHTPDLGFTSVGGQGLAHLTGMRSLDTLELAGTKVTDAGLARLRELLRLRERGKGEPGPVSLRGSGTCRWRAAAYPRPRWPVRERPPRSCGTSLTLPAAERD